MNGLTRHIRLEQPVMIGADLRSAAPRPGRSDPPPASATCTCAPRVRLPGRP